jgi:hypothetical protein
MRLVHKASKVVESSFLLALIANKINRPPQLRWAMNRLRERSNQAGFAQWPEADYHYYYHHYWRSKARTCLPQVGGIIAQSTLVAIVI